MSKRPRGRPFQRGQSGNPGGRPIRTKTIEARRIIADVKVAARELTPKALTTLEAAMDETSAPWAAKVTAAMGVLAYGWGRPKETIETTHRMTLEELVLGSMRPKRALDQIDDVPVAKGEHSVPLIGRRQ